MKFLFLDESDKEEKGKRRYFLICGLFVDADQLLDLNNDLEAYKESEGFANFKDFRKSRMFQKEKLRKTEEIFSVLSKHNVKVLTAILGETTMGSISKFQEAYVGALYFLMERFALQIRPDKGMVFFDKMEGSVQSHIENYFFDTVLKEDLKMFGKKLAEFKELIYPSISFINDKYSAILQVSDLISTSFNFAIAKSLEKTNFISTSGLSDYSPYLAIYWPLVVKSNLTDEVDGWGIKLWD